MLDLLIKKYSLKAVAPLSVNIKEQTFVFDCLIEGYGAKNGMVIDKDSTKLMSVAKELVTMNYGFSCFDITTDCDVETFQEILDDWGKFN